MFFDDTDDTDMGGMAADAPAPMEGEEEKDGEASGGAM